MTKDHDAVIAVSELKQLGVAFSFGELHNAGQSPYLKLQCPKHDDPGSNLRLFLDQRSFHCFHCGWNGEMASLISMLKASQDEQPSRAA